MLVMWLLVSLAQLHGSWPALQTQRVTNDTSHYEIRDRRILKELLTLRYVSSLTEEQQKTTNKPQKQNA